MVKNSPKNKFTTDLFGIIFMILGGFCMKWSNDSRSIFLYIFLYVLAIILFILAAILAIARGTQAGLYSSNNLIVDIAGSIVSLLLIFYMPFDIFIQIILILKNIIGRDSSQSRVSKLNTSEIAILTNIRACLKIVSSTEYDFDPNVKKIVEGILLFREEKYEESITKLEDGFEKIKIISDIAIKMLLGDIINFYKAEQIEQITIGYAILALQYFLLRAPDDKTKLFGKITTYVGPDSEKADETAQTMETMMSVMDMMKKEKGLSHGQVAHTINDLIKASAGLSPAVQTQDSKTFLAILYQLLGDYACNLNNYRGAQVKVEIADLQAAMSSYQSSVILAEEVGQRKAGTHSKKMIEYLNANVSDPHLLGGFIDIVKADEIQEEQVQQKEEPKEESVRFGMSDWTFHCDKCGIEGVLVGLIGGEKENKMKCPLCNGETRLTRS